MNKPLNDIRREVDRMRAAMSAGHQADPAQIAALARSTESVGLDAHAGGHRCPWHTCQATRH